MDSASASLIYELLRSDTAAELDRVKRVKITQPDSDSPDHEVALKSWEREIDRFQSRPQDFIAVLERANMVDESEPDHASDDDDHDDDEKGLNGDDSSSEPSIDDLNPFDYRNPSFMDDDPLSTISRSSSLSLLSRTPSLSNSETDAPASNLQGCIACMEALPAQDMIKCPCSHYYCNSCIDTFVEASLADISIFPPKCCSTPIPWPTIKPVIEDALSQKFEERLAEVKNSPPPVPQTICSDTRCLAPIPADKVRDHVGICPKCKRSTCTFCGNESHAGDCNNKKHWKMLERTAKQEKWKMCPNCKAFVERTCGCNHIRYAYLGVCSSWLEKKMLTTGL